MDIINAIAKVRFASARPQKVHLGGLARTPVELLCMEPGQKLQVPHGQWAYYVVSGTACVESKITTAHLPAGQVAVTAMDEDHTIAAEGEHRLVCLVIGK